MSEKIKWWGYLHTNGTIQIKRYFSELDLDDAYESPFVRQIVMPFEADCREEAALIIEKKLKERYSFS